jgi:hypothetical protein
LVSELCKFETADGLTAWTHTALPRKNQLTNADACTVEAAFEAQLARLGEVAQDLRPKDPRPEGRVTLLSKPVRERDRAHLKFVAGEPCLICARIPSDPHHIKFADRWTVGRKVSDRFTVPLCRLHHRELHRRGNERLWWQQKAIEPLNIAKALWNKTHDPASDDIAGDPGHAIKRSNEPVQRARLATRIQNDETKPTAGPEVR